MKTSCEKCGSSDGVEIYEDHEWCYACSEYNPNNKPNEDPLLRTANTIINERFFDEINTCKSYPMNSRGITQEVVDFFNVKMGVNSEGNPAYHYYPYTKGGQTVAYKERQLPKQFRTIQTPNTPCLLYTSPSPRD